MAVTKIWAIHDSVSRVVDYCTNPSKTKLSDLEQVLLYAADKEKTLDEGEQQYAVTGIGCRAESAAREMAAVQRRFGKAGGNVAYHAYQSFKTGEVTAEECHRIGVETARRLWGNDRQVLVATHFNTGTYHNHFVVNPVNMWTGKKLEAKYEVYYKLRDMQGAWPVGGEKSPAAQNGAVGLLRRKERRAHPLQPHAAGTGRGANDVKQLDGAERRAAEEGLCVRVRSLPQVRHHPLSKR